jgi:hypothetical protein
MQESAAKAQAELQEMIRSMHAARERFSQAQAEERRAKLTQRNEESFQRKQKEGKFSLDPSKRPKWRSSDRYLPQELVYNKTYLPAGDITATEQYRSSHLIPRTYAKSHTAFLMTKNVGDIFPSPVDSLLSRQGRSTLAQRRLIHKDEVDRRHHEEMKPKVVEFGPRWEPTRGKGGLLSAVSMDAVNYYSRDLPQSYLQEKPFLRTNRSGGYFEKPAV